jgi:hypothetical protein
MLDAEIKQLFQKFGKDFAEAAAKHIAAKLSTESGGPSYADTPSRGSKLVSDDSLLQKGGGKIPAAAALNRSVKEMSESFERANRNIFKKAGESVSSVINTAFHPLAAFSQKQKDRFEEIVGDTRQFADEQLEEHRKMVQHMIGYIEKPGTDLSKLSDTTNLLEEYNVKLHELANNTKSTSAEYGELFNKITNLQEATAGAVDVMGLLDDETQKTLKQMRTKGPTVVTDKSSDDDKAQYAKEQQALGKLASAMEGSAEVMSEATQMVTTNIQRTIEQHSMKMGTLMKSMAGVSVYGAKNMMDDILFRYQANISESFHEAGVRMGMSQDEISQGLLRYRDTLRQEAMSMDGSLYDAANEEAMLQIADAGKAFGLIGGEAFSFGMRIKESAKFTGMAADLNTKEMVRFYKEAANALNVPIQEFGEIFNDMSKDPAFVGFANNLRLLGSSTQKVLVNEMKSRIKMNKILGLSNENMQQRLNMENAKKWAPIVEKYKSMMGAGQLAEQYERVLGIELSDDQKEILKKYAFDPSNLTAEQKKTFNETIAPLMEAGPALFQERYTQMIQNAQDRGDEAEANRLIAEKAQAQEILQLFGGFTGEMFDVNRSEQVNAALNNLADKTGISKEEIMNQITSGTVNAQLQQAMDTLSGANELLTGKESEGYEQTGGYGMGTEFAYKEINEFVQGLTKSSLVQTFSGIGVAGFTLASSMLQNALLMKALTVGGLGQTAAKAGILSKAFTKVTGRFSTFSLNPFNKTIAGAQVGVKGLDTGIRNATSGVAGSFKTFSGNLLKVAGAAAMAYQVWELGTQAGTAMYEKWKDEDWFIGAGDILGKTIDFIKPWGDDRASQDELDAENIRMVNEARRNRLQAQLDKVGQGHLVKGMSTEEINKRLGLDGAGKALKAQAEAMEEANRINETKGKSGKSVEELLEENNDIQRENQKMNKDKIAEDRVENEKRNSASDILAQARDAAKRSHEAAYTEVDSLRSTAIMSGRW